ncbi:hypothetical protein SRHO_G00247570 [Serrasalmus rhombeus]
MMELQRPAALLTAVILMVVCSTAEPDDVKLVGGSSRCAGTVKVFHTGEWRSVAAVQWSIKDAAVVCRQLDCGSAVAAPRRSSSGPESPWSVQIECEGSESALRECRSSYQDIWYRAEVICSEPADVRMVGGSSRCAGDLEMFNSGEWRKTRSFGWPLRAAAVVCRQLDCGSVAFAINKRSGMELSRRNIGVKCTGSESALRECWNTYDRGYQLEVICSDVKLVDGSSRCAGTVMLYDKKWRTVEGNAWSMKDAAVVCRQLDCGSAVAVTNQYLEMTTYEDDVRISCSGSESGLKECAVHDISWSLSSAGVICSGQQEATTAAVQKEKQSWSPCSPGLKSSRVWSEELERS